MSKEFRLDLSHYYGLARDLRADLKRHDQHCQREAAERFRQLTDFSSLESDRILRKKISLRQAKEVIAKEQGYGDWPDLRLAIEKAIEDIQQQCEGRYFPKGVPEESGDVVEGDLILLGTFSERCYVVDAILMTLYEAVDCSIGPGVVMMELDAPDFNPEDIPDLPEEDSGWSDWSVLAARALGVEGA
jgi:hypothetical protein